MGPDRLDRGACAGCQRRHGAGRRRSARAVYAAAPIGAHWRFAAHTAAL